MSMKFDWFRDARMKLVTREARKAASDTDELWQQLRARFPVQAWAVGKPGLPPVHLKRVWLGRDCIVIGG